MYFHPRPPYDFQLTICAAQYYSVLGQQVGNAYRRVVRMDGALALIELRDGGTVDAPRIEARLLAATAPVDPAALERKIAHLLNLHVDMRPFEQYARSRRGLSETAERLRGLHSLQLDTLFEALAVTMIEQQIALRMAQTAERWLIELAGDSLVYDGERYYAFPTPERIAMMTVDDLKPLKITFMRMERLIAVARAAASGVLDLEALRAAPRSALYARLIGLKGVGHWTASWAMLRAAGHYLYFGSADVALRAAVNAYVYGQKGRAPRDQTDAFFTSLGDHAGLAAFYIIMRWALERY